MKKVFLTLFLCLLFSGLAYAKKAPADATVQRLIDTNKIYIGMSAYEMSSLIPGFKLVDAGFGGEGGWAHNTRFFRNYAFVGWADYNVWDGGRGYYKIFVFEKKDSKKKRGCGRACQNGFKTYKGTATQLKFTNKNKLIAIKDDFKSATEYLLEKEPLANLFLNEILEYENKWGKIFGRGGVSVASRIKPKKKEEQQEAIMFTIKDKRDQCEAIGFKPKTEKFADCVLRLVELDVKKQQSNKIASAQNSGNEALVKQLQRQQYDRGTDALLNLGQQLLNPRTTNSNIYMPQTQRCTIQGFGTFAKMVCR